MTIMKRITSITAGLLFAVSASADIEWSVKDQAILGPDDEGNESEVSFTTPLQGNAFSSTGGYFVQLIYAGANGVADAIPSPNSLGDTGVQNDDVVAATRWVGAGRFADGAGKFNSGSPFADDVVGNYLFVHGSEFPTTVHWLLLPIQPLAYLHKRYPLVVRRLSGVCQSGRWRRRSADQQSRLFSTGQIVATTSFRIF